MGGHGWPISIAPRFASSFEISFEAGERKKVLMAVWSCMHMVRSIHETIRERFSLRPNIPLPSKPLKHTQQYYSETEFVNFNSRIACSGRITAPQIHDHRIIDRETDGRRPFL